MFIMARPDATTMHALQHLNSQVELVKQDFESRSNAFIAKYGKEFKSSKELGAEAKTEYETLKNMKSSIGILEEIASRLKTVSDKLKKLDQMIQKAKGSVEPAIKEVEQRTLERPGRNFEEDIKDANDVIILNLNKDKKELFAQRDELIKDAKTIIPLPDYSEPLLNQKRNVEREEQSRQREEQAKAEAKAKAEAEAMKQAMNEAKGKIKDMDSISKIEHDVEGGASVQDRFAKKVNDYLEKNPDDKVFKQQLSEHLKSNPNDKIKMEQEKQKEQFSPRSSKL